MGCGSSSDGGATSPTNTSGEDTGGKGQVNSKNNNSNNNNNNKNAGDNKTSNSDANKNAKNSNRNSNKSGKGSKYETQSNSAPSETSEQKEASDKGFKKRLRDKLRAATAGSDMDELEKTMERFEKARLEDCGDYTKAQSRLRFLKLRRDLRDAMRRRHVGILDKTIKDAQSSEFAGQLQSQIQAAEELRDHLKELNTYNHDILEMEQTTISELRSYQRPPSCVHDVMAASYMLLGEKEDHLEDWTDIQAHLGKLGRESLMRRVAHFDTNDLDDETTNRVKELLEYHNLDEVRAASNGAGTFHVWATQMVEKCDKDKAEDEEKRRQEEEEARKAQQTPAANSKKKKG